MGYLCNSKQYIMKILTGLFYVILALGAFSQNTEPKNIIVFISDGGGYNQILATDYYLMGDSGTAPYANFPVQMAMSTYPASYENGGTTSYNTREAWTRFSYNSNGYTESAASATALATGYKTMNGRVGSTVNGQPLTNISEIARSNGKAYGVVSSVPFNHATPAGFLVHNESRKNYSALSWEMILSSGADVIMGAGSPYHDNDGLEVDTPNFYGFGSKNLYSYLLENNHQFDNHLVASSSETDWIFTSSRVVVQEIAQGESVPSRLFVLAPVAKTLSEMRSDTSYLPGDNRTNENIPTLKEMSLAALQVLSQNQNGFFLMIEGGAIDWANHDNYTVRMIEEYASFYLTVEGVIQFLEYNGMLDETLIIVTSDHECGNFWGPGCNESTFVLPQNQGLGNIPASKYYSDDHSNQLVPFYATGPYSEIYYQFADEIDSVRGPYLTNSEVALGIKMLWGNTTYIYEAFRDSADAPRYLYATAPCINAEFQWYFNGFEAEGVSGWKIDISNAAAGTVFECEATCGSKSYWSNKFVLK